MIKLALTDLDNTLIRFGLPHANASTIDAIHAAQAAGVHFGPVTGRPPCSMRWMFPDNPECAATGAFSNGQVVQIDGERVHVVGIERELLNRVAELADELGDVYLVVHSLDDPDDSFYVTKRRDRLRSHPTLSVEVKPFSIVERLERDYVKANLQCWRSMPQERVQKIRRELCARIPELDYVFPSPAALVIDLVPHGWTKGSAALLMAEYLGIGPDEVAVFGDSENDLAMMRDIPNSVAVANADPEVASCARWHIGHCADGAVDDALLDIAEAAAMGTMPRFMRE